MTKKERIPAWNNSGDEILKRLAVKRRRDARHTGLVSAVLFTAGLLVGFLAAGL